MAQLTTPWYRRTLRRLDSFRSVPLRRLWVLLAAVFLLFCVNGYYLDLRNYGTMPYAIVLMVAAYSGLNAMLWVVVPARLPSIFYLPLIVLQFFNGYIMTVLAYWMRKHFTLAAVKPEAGVRLAASGMLFSSIAAYIFLLIYILREEKQSLRIKNQLELAHGIQKTLVPPLTLITARAEIYGISCPSEQVGGDLVDAVLLTDDDAVAYRADIAGHGLQAGILMGMLKTATRTALLNAGDRGPQRTLPKLLDQLNTILPQVKEANMYATFTGLRLGADGSVFAAMAASPPLLQWHAATRTISHTQEPQLPLGLLPFSGFEAYPLQVEPGDLLVVATDGILEVTNTTKEEFGLERLQAVIAEVSHLPLPQLAGNILAAAHRFGPQLDDQTILLVRCL